MGKIAPAPVLFAVLVAVVAAGYWFLFVDTVFTCNRANDSCEVVEVNQLRRDITHQFRPSEVVSARFEPTRKKSCAVVTMKGGAPEIWLCPRVGEEYVELLNDFVADPKRERLDYRIEPSIIELALLGVVAGMVVFPLSVAIRRRRRSS